jgi:hypothetical protein
VDTTPPSAPIWEAFLALLECRSFPQIARENEERPTGLQNIAYWVPMATKKAKKKKVAKAKAKTAKRSSAGRAKKSSPQRRKKSVARKPPKRKTPSASARTKAKAKAKPRKERTPPRSATKRAAKPFRREDRPGHLDPHYSKELRKQSGAHEDAQRAFIERPRSPNDDLAEELGESVVEKATTGEDEVDEDLDQIVPEEQGGPFVETNAAQEFGHGTDASNPKGAKREPFPTT